MMKTTGMNSLVTRSNLYSVFAICAISGVSCFAGHSVFSQQPGPLAQAPAFATTRTVSPISHGQTVLPPNNSGFQSLLPSNNHPEIRQVHYQELPRATEMAPLPTMSAPTMPFGVYSEPVIPTPVLPMPMPVVPVQATVAAPPQQQGVSEQVMKSYRLRNLDAHSFELRLREKLAKRFAASASNEPTGNLAKYRMIAADNRPLELTIDRHQKIVAVTGSAQMVDAGIKIVYLLDSIDTATTKTEFVAVQPSDIRHVRTLMNTIVTETNKGTPATQPHTFQRANENPSVQFTQPNPAYSQQAGPPGAGPVQRDTAPSNTAATSVSGLAGSGIVGPVKVEIIEGPDIPIITGPREDVQKIISLLEQLEVMNREILDPIIELVPMKNTDCTRISQIVEQIYDRMYSQRRGAVAMLSLVKPNTILLIGKKENIDMVKELIDKLDVPVDPASEFMVIHLKNASADMTASQVNTFYQNRQQLGAQVFAVSDARTNSIIIQANPRDLIEVASMVRRLDNDDDRIAVNQIKTFSLQNAMAVNLATTLQNAVAGTAASGTTGRQTRNPVVTTVVEAVTLDEQGRLRANVLADVSITADQLSNTLIVNAPEETMPLIEALIRQLDKIPAAESQIKIFTLHNGDAQTLTNVLQTIFATTTGTTGIGGTAASQMVNRRPGIEEGESSLVSIRLSTDIRTNSIIACGSVGDLVTIEAILTRLDGDNMNNRTVSLFNLSYVPAQNVATALSNYISTERQLENQNPSLLAPQSPLEQYRKEVIIIPETVTNRLIVSSTPQYAEQIRKIVQQLDERPNMVSIQVLVAEVSLKNNSELGVELGLQDSLFFDRSIMSGAAGTLIPGFLFGDPAQGLPLGNVRPGNVGTQGITSLGVNRFGSNGYSGFAFSASGESVSVLVRALEESSRIRVLNRPQITTFHNMRATVTVGEEIPFASNTTNTQSGITTTPDFKEVGIALDVVPRIAADSTIMMDIYVQRSNLIDIVEVGPGAYAPHTNMTKGQTTISVQDNQTIVIGGLISEQKTVITRGVPGLNKIPVVKNFFEYKQTKCDRSEMLIIMTPTIIRSEEDLIRLREQESARMHWCLSDVVKLTGNSNMQSREYEWSPYDAPMTKGQPTILNESQLPSDDKVIRELPIPTLAPQR